MGLAKLPPKVAQGSSQASDAAVADFLGRAPDGIQKKKELQKGRGNRQAISGFAREEVRQRGAWQLKGRKVIVTHSFDPEVLMALDNMAETAGRSRAFLINYAVLKMLEEGIEIPKVKVKGNTNFTSND